jgi:hypothetical protein
MMSLLRAISYGSASYKDRTAAAMELDLLCVVPLVHTHENWPHLGQNGKP